MKMHCSHNSAGGRGDSRRSQRRGGFTLIELLVVIAILAILAALLLPALSRAKEQGRKISCINRFSQWNKALRMYADENEDFIPRESFIPGGTFPNYWPQAQNALAIDVWYNVLPRLMNERPASAFASEVVRRDFYDRAKLLHCPSARFPSPDVQDDSRAYFSIAMNSQLIPDNLTTMKLGAVQKESATVTFLDNRLPDEPKVDPMQDDDHLGQPSAFANRFVTRHLGRGTLAFADGHVECLAGRDVVTNGTAIFPQVRIIWDPNQ